MIPVMFIITFLVFSLLWAVPGDPVYAYVGIDVVLDAEQLALLREKYNLNEPFLVQYFLWLQNVFQGDLGRSVESGLKVSEELMLSLIHI